MTDPTATQSTATQSTATQSTATQAILRPALNNIVEELGKPAELEVATLNIAGQWAFLHARISAPGGEKISYAGTKFAEAAEHGGKSSMYAGLFQGGGEHWRLVASAVGPTDVAWWNWSKVYEAPAEVFKLSR